MGIFAVGMGVLFCALAGPGASAQAAEFKAVAVYTATASPSGVALKASGTPIGGLTREGGTERLTVDGVVTAEIVRTAGAATFPRAVSVTGGRPGAAEAARVSMEFTEVAPAAPFKIEEQGPSDRGLLAWLSRTAGTTPMAAFQADFTRETGRGLSKWYELSGRVRDGVIRVGGTVAARFYTGYQIDHEGGAYKVHHRGDTLEHADVIVAGEGGNFVSFRCGCHGFPEFSPKISLPGFEYAVGLETNGGFLNTHYGRLHRMPLRYSISDARGEEFASIEISYSDEEDFTKARYRFFAAGPDGRVEIARARVIGPSSRLEIGTDVEALDALLAMLPTQTLRGDGVRDSLLGQVETLLDWVRYLRAPSSRNLADVMSVPDAATAMAKVRAYLGTHRSRFETRRDPGEAPPGVVCTDDGCRFVPEAR